MPKLPKSRVTPKMPEVPESFKDFGEVHSCLTKIKEVFDDFSTYIADDFRKTYLDLHELFGFEGSATWDPGSIADGNEEAKEVTVTGAQLGDFAFANFSLDVQDLVLDAQVTADDTVTCILANNTGGAIDLAEGTVYVKVVRRV